MPENKDKLRKQLIKEFEVGEYGEVSENGYWIINPLELRNFMREHQITYDARLEE